WLVVLCSATGGSVASPAKTSVPGALPVSFTAVSARRCDVCNQVAAATPLLPALLTFDFELTATISARMSSMSFDEAQRLASRLRAELGRAIVGQDAVVREILTAFFAGGHCL